MRGYLTCVLREAIDLCPHADQFKDAPAALRDTAALLRVLGERRVRYVSDARVPIQKRLVWAEAIDTFLCADAYAQRKPTATIEALLAAVFEQPVECAPAYALRSLLHLERGRLTKALADADRALQLDPWEARAYFVRGRVRLERADADALADLDRAALLTRRQDGTLLHWLAAAEFHAGEHALALATQREALKLLPTDSEIHDQLREFQKMANKAR